MKNLTLNAAVDGVTFPIQVKRSVQANAADYYERKKKAERKLEGSEKALRETQQRIDELRKEWTGKIEETQAEAPTKQARREWYEKFRWFVSSDGFLVIGGRDATTNEIIIKKHLEQQDIVFHADVVGAPFVVVKTQGRTPTNEVIQEAAQLGASYSRAWGASLGAVDVYWVTPSQISKSSPSGQYLEKGAFIIQGPKNYVKQVPLRLAIGVQKTEDRFRVIGGPIAAVRKQTEVLVEIAPGGQPSARLAKQLRHLLAERASREDREAIRKARIEEIQQFIPMGKGTIVEKKK
jgi:predicted ribosome quality control (RQC) complex YloA/Tae2 family protein